MAGRSFAISVALTAIDNVTRVTRTVANNAVHSLQRIENASERWRAKLKSGLLSPLGSIAGTITAYLTYDKLKEAYIGCVKAATDEIAAENRLRLLFKNNPILTGKNFENMKEYSEQLMQQTAITHESFQVAAGQLATYQLHYDSIKKLLPAIADLAGAQYGLSVNEEQLLDTTKTLGRAFLGNAGRALKSFGIGLTANQEKLLKTGTEAQRVALLLSKVDNRFRGLRKAQANSDPGRDLLMRINIGEMSEDIGRRLIPLRHQFLKFAWSLMPTIQTIADRLLPVLEKAVKWVVEMADRITKWAKANPQTAKTLALIAGVLVAIVALAGPILTVISAVTTFIATIGAISAAFQVAGIGAAISTAFAAWPVLLVTAAILVVAGLAFLVVRNWDKVKAWFSRFWNWLSGSSPMAKVLQWIPLVGIPVLIIKNWDKVKTWFKTFRDFFVKLWDEISGSAGFKTFLKAASWVGGKAAAAGKWIGKQGTAAWNWAVTDPNASRPTVPTGRAALTGSSQGSAPNGHVMVEVKAPRGTRSTIKEGSRGVSLRQGVSHAAMQ